MDTNFVNGLFVSMMEQLVESVTTEVIKRLPYYTECEAKLKTIEEQLAKLEKNMSTVVTSETVDGIVTDKMSDYVLTDDLQSAVEENMPDVAELVNENLPDMDDYVLKSDLDEAVLDTINEQVDLENYVEKAEFDKVKQQANNVRVLLHNIKTEIEQHLSPALK